MMKCIKPISKVPHRIISNEFDERDLSKLSMGSTELLDSVSITPQQIITNLFDLYDESIVSDLSMGSTEKFDDDTIVSNNGDNEISVRYWVPAAYNKRASFSKNIGVLPPTRPKRMTSTGSTNEKKDEKVHNLINPPQRPARRGSIVLPKPDKIPSSSKISFKKLGILPPSRPTRLASVEEQPAHPNRSNPSIPIRRMSIGVGEKITIVSRCA